MDHMFSIGQVGRRLGIQPYRIAYAIETGQLPEAQFHFLHKRCFTEADVRGIAQFFGVEVQKETQ
jgi:hypothetical protein